MPDRESGKGWKNQDHNISGREKMERMNGDGRQYDVRLAVVDIRRMPWP